MEPQEKLREITDRYTTFEQALLTFFHDIRATNYEEFFPDLRQLGLFDGH